MACDAQLERDSVPREAIYYSLDSASSALENQFLSQFKVLTFCTPLKEATTVIARDEELSFIGNVKVD